MSEIKLKEETRAIADTLKTQFELEGNEFRLTDAKEAYASTLPEGLTADTAEVVHKHDRQYVHAFALAAGEVSMDAVKANKELRYGLTSTQVGISNVDVLVKREATVAAGIAKAGEKVPTKDVKGHTIVKLTTSSGDEMSKIKKHIASLGEVNL